MKANELMIGNWVEPDQCMIPIVYCKVLGIYPDGTVNLDKAERLFTLDELHPIPLTPEVLEKNGFKRDPLWHPYAKDLDGYSISVQFGYANRIKYIKIAEKGIDDAIPSEKTKLYLTHINYVHELQHAMRICGIEKEIEL